MELGPFITTIDQYLDIDVEGEDQLDIYPDSNSEDIRLMRLMLGDEPTGERSVSGGNLKVEWAVYISKDDDGFGFSTPEFLRVYGTLTIEDLPPGADPNDPDVELEEYEFEFDSKESDFQLSVVDWNDCKVGSFIAPTRIELGFRKDAGKKPYAKLSFESR